MVPHTLSDSLSCLCLIYKSVSLHCCLLLFLFSHLLSCTLFFCLSVKLGKSIHLLASRRNPLPNTVCVCAYLIQSIRFSHFILFAFQVFILCNCCISSFKTRIVQPCKREVIVLHQCSKLEHANLLPPHAAHTHIHPVDSNTIPPQT